jgi:hypothetical protein
MLYEVLRVAARVAAPVLREKDAVGVLSPARAGPTDVSRPEACGKYTTVASATDVIDEATHGRSVPLLLTSGHGPLSHSVSARCSEALS